MRITDDIRERVNALAEMHDGRITPDIVLADARNVASPLHALYNWDADQAAHEHWLDISRRIIRSVRVVIREERSVIRAVLISFEAERHAYAIDGVSVPSVTEVLAPQNDWSHVDAWALEAARCLGQDVHAAVNLLARDALDWESLDPAIAAYVRGAERFLKASGAVVLASEQVVASKSLGVAGTLDLFVLWNGWHYFIDWKVSATVPSTVGAQLAAYQQLYCETFRSGRKLVRSRRACVRLKPDAYTVDRIDEPNGDWSLFLSCLNAYKHRQRRSYA